MESLNQTIFMDSKNSYYTYDNESKDNIYDNLNHLELKKHYSINSRYEIMEEIGKGAFGKVYKATDFKRHQLVALKVVRNEKRFHKQVKEEIKLFETIITSKKNYSNHLIPLYKWFTYKTDYFLVFQVFGINLYSYYLKYDIDDDDLCSFSYQIADGLDFIHSFKIIHADLKPENILIKDKHLKLIDLGSSFKEGPSQIKSYVQSRYYRAPEVVFRHPIKTSMDIWSYGCILYEIAMKYPLIPAKNHQDLVVFYKHIMGYPDNNMKEYFISYDVTLHTSVTKNRRFYGTNEFVWDYHNNKFYDLVLSNCLTWDASKRLTAKDIMGHSYFTDLKKID